MDGNVTAIELQGIVRNRTKIGVEDGQAEDILNLRFRDGSWRASGDGRCVFSMAETGSVYSQLYIHTNGYHHLLGVREGKLWWFADIDNDGVTFTALDEPVEMTSVSGDVWITQTGHLLTVIDGAEDFEYFVFKTNEVLYKKVVLDQNGKSTDRGVFPFGRVHFNLYSPIDEEHTHTKEQTTAYHTLVETAHADMLEMFEEATEKNQFTRPFLVIVAVKDYSGKYILTQNPVLIHPRELSNIGGGYSEVWEMDANGVEERVQHSPQEHTPEGYADIYMPNMPIPKENSDLIFNESVYSRVADELKSFKYARARKLIDTPSQRGTLEYIPKESLPSYVNGCGFLIVANANAAHSLFSTKVFGSDLCMSIEDTDFLTSNSDLFSSLCIFVTPQVDIYDMSSEGYKKSPFYNENNTTIPLLGQHSIYVTNYNQPRFDYVTEAYGYCPKKRTNQEIIYDLIHRPFYLLREYNSNSINEIMSNPVVNLSDPEYNNLLTTITEQNPLEIEATSRLTYIPRYSYTYNGRLHIANYKTTQFHGYPLDLFLLHNHSVKLDEGESYKGILPNLADNNDEYVQYGKQEYKYLDVSEADEQLMLETMKNYNDVFAQVIVEIETDNGVQKAVKYIDGSNLVKGIGRYFEDFSPLITFPDYRAKKITIKLLWCNDGGYYIVGARQDFELKPHPLYNFAYFIKPDLTPIYINDFLVGSSRFDEYTNVRHSIENILQPEENMEEQYPNGLKVSRTGNPLSFPVENTYQVGTSEILALMSNSIAVGTGQTGDAPLYVFCKDGVYALYVDSSGQMTYSNARIIARDVCNNPRSVTPIDTGVVFTTDRGLMMIAGDQVQELGAPAEGDVLQYARMESTDYIKIAAGALNKVAELPVELCDTTDFLTYLKGAVINYNHNDRELMVSNPQFRYSYIMDRNSMWSRRDYTADEYINNYPTSYRIENRLFYKVDEEGDANTSLEHRKEADNKIFYLSNVIKLGSIGFKQGARFVVRGYFNCKENKHVGCYVFGSYDGRRWAMLGGNEKQGTFSDIGCKIERTDVKFYRVCIGGQLRGDSRIDYMEISSESSVLNTKIR